MTGISVAMNRDLATGRLDSRYDENGDIKVVLLGRANFSVPLPPPTIRDGYVFGVANGTPFIESGALRMNYPALVGDPLYEGGIYNSLHFDVPDGHKELYIKFDAKMPNAKHGLKFCKIFGRNATGGPNTVANTTFGLQYTHSFGSMTEVSFGDGTTEVNDTSQILSLSGENPSYIGRSYNNGATVTSAGINWVDTEWGSGWHTFRFKIKFNDGTAALNEVNNGEIFVSIDGLEYVRATGIFNRHYTNGDIAFISFGDWTQAPTAGSPAFDIHYDNIFISVNGFYEGV